MAGCFCEQEPGLRQNQNNGYYNGYDMYANELPVRDTTPYGPRNGQFQQPCLRMVPERDIPPAPQGIPNNYVVCPTYSPDYNGTCYWASQSPPPPPQEKYVVRTKQRKSCCPDSCCSPRRVRYPYPPSCYNPRMQNQYNGPRSMMQPPPRQMYSQQLYEQKPPTVQEGKECTCPPQETKKEANTGKPPVQDKTAQCTCSQKETKKEQSTNRSQSRRKQKVSSSSSEGCMCNEGEEETNENEHKTNFFNPMCCPCQQMNCPCLENICCTCAQNLRCSMQQNTARQTKPKKKKKKTCKCNCTTQTKCESRDKCVCTTLLQVSDACVCCKPKNKSVKTKKTKPASKTCWICKQSMKCTGRCCPCLLRPMCCPCKNSNDTDEKDSSEDESESEKHTKKTTVIKKDQKKSANKNTVQALPLQIESDPSVKSPTKYNNKKHLQYNLNILNDITSKPTTSRKQDYNKIFPNTRFASPLTGTEYNMDTTRIRDPNLKKYRSFDLINVNDSIAELMAAVNRVQGDPEHRKLLTAVCDALLHNRRESIEGGESSFLDEYTYTNNINSFCNNQFPSNANPINNRGNSTLRTAFNNNFSNFTQTDQIIDFSKPNVIKINEAHTNTQRKNPLITTNSVTDPINLFFNEITQTEVDELFEEYMKKIRYNTLFSNLKDEDCQAKNETKDDTTETSRQKELATLKDALSQYDKYFNNSDENKENQDLQTIQSEKPKVSDKNEWNDKVIKNENKIVTKHENDSKIKLDESKSNKRDVIKTHDSVFTEIKSNRPSASQDGMSTKKHRQTLFRKFTSEHRCLNIDEDTTKLSIHSPLNVKSNHHDDVYVVKTSPASNPQKKQMKRQSASGDINLKKRKLQPPTTSLVNHNEVNNYNFNNDISTKFKSKIPVIIKSRSLLQDIDTLSSKTSILSSNPSHLLIKTGDQDFNSKIGDTSGILMELDLKKTPADSCNKLCKNEISEKKSDYEKGNPFTTNVYDRYFNSFTDSELSSKDIDSKNVDKTFNNNLPDSKDFSKNTGNKIKNSISNTEIMISSIKYDSEDNNNMPNETTDYDAFDSDGFSLSSENQKSTLSIIREENESDIAMNKMAFNIEKYLDTCTSPFDFRAASPRQVDSCNSPFEMRKGKERKMSLGLFCFTSKDKDSDAYKLADSSSSSEAGKSKSKEKRWRF